VSNSQSFPSTSSFPSADSRAIDEDGDTTNNAIYLANALSLLGIYCPLQELMRGTEMCITSSALSQTLNCMYSLLRFHQVPPPPKVRFEPCVVANGSTVIGRSEATGEEGRRPSRGLVAGAQARCRKGSLPGSARLGSEHAVPPVQKRLVDRVDQLEREAGMCQARERSLKESMEKEKAKWNVERQEMRRQLLALQHKDTQYLVHAESDQNLFPE